MIQLEHYQNANDIFDNGTFTDDGSNFTISYEYDSRYFTVTMRYFFQDEILFGFVHYDELSEKLDKESAYLVGCIIELYIHWKFNKCLCMLMFYTDKHVEDNFHEIPTFSFSHVIYYTSGKMFESKKYKFYKVTRFNVVFKTMTNQYLADYLDNQL